ncbi:hypothetical protein FOCG_04031 [Fusarium oxysporum f. sp. radicis-lycopersici 26381]|nr:hypothetical protein FOCG_04031 [Fusarium oxysporum f. sp. radicis-lycopersici 26381]
MTPTKECETECEPSLGCTIQLHSYNSVIITKNQSPSLVPVGMSVMAHEPLKSWRSSALECVLLKVGLIMRATA